MTPKRRRWATDVIERQNGQMTRMVDDLLDVARIGTGKIQLHKEPLDLATVLDRAVETTRPVIRENRHELVTDYPHGSLFAEADADRVEQIFVNLLTNASKYTPPHGHLALRANRAGRSMWKWSCRTMGSALRPRKLAGIFHLFMQGERPAAPRQERSRTRSDHRAKAGRIARRAPSPQRATAPTGARNSPSGCRRPLLQRTRRHRQLARFHPRPLARVFWSWTIMRTRLTAWLVC